ncbi:agmatinase [soil metagenome]
MDKISYLESLFIPPESTVAGHTFCDIPIPITFEGSKICIIGIPIDITTTFGKTASFGPEAIRIASAEQIETLVFEENVEIYEKALIYDIGDFNFVKPREGRISNIEEINKFWVDFDSKLSSVLKIIIQSNKIPVILGGEHTITYSIYKELSESHPLLIHFDAHRDMKSIYQGMSMCHTTPFYHLIKEGYLRGNDLVQIGIRQGDRGENKFALDNGVITFDAWDCNISMGKILQWLKSHTYNRDIYISFDIDVYDISYLPCTGTPEPFGLNPFQILELINSISNTARLVGLDFVETGLKNNDYREGALATQTLLRILSRSYMANL